MTPEQIAQAARDVADDYRDRYEESRSRVDDAIVVAFDKFADLIERHGNPL